MSDGTPCPQCGTPLPAGALAGLCPACLLQMGAAADTVTDAKQPAFNPPGVAELAPLFPQLEIIELIGKGGMGAVYKARQKQLDRLVALKILPPGIGKDPAFAGRFAREAKALAKLNHPGIVTLYEFGETSGQFYFLMEFVDGVNLRQLLAGSRVSPREALAIVPQICDALQFAHDQGIVHRDIKPENILLDRRGRVKVADFGLAKIVNETGNTGLESPVNRQAGKPALQSELTDAGRVMGTPQYMSPEQIQAPGEVDHRADIYALGVVFYQMLTGELPGKKIEAPSKKVQIDVRLDEIVLRALEKKPELRYQQASVLKTQVETIAEAGTPETAIKTDAPGQVFCYLAVTCAVITVLALILALVIHPNPHLIISAVWAGALGTLIFGGLVFWQNRRAKLDPAFIQGIKAWLAVIDGGGYAESWDAAAKRFQKALAKPEWIDRLNNARKPQGAVISRKIRMKSGFGPRFTVKFDTTFTGLKAVVETVTFLRERDGKWRAIGYLILPAYAEESRTRSMGRQALFFAGLSGVLGAATFCLWPHPPGNLVWGIPVAALSGILFGNSARPHRFGKRAIAIGGINLAIWTVILVAWLTMTHHSATPAMELSPAEFLEKFQTNDIAQAGIKIDQQSAPLATITGTYFKIDASGRLTRAEVPFVVHHAFLAQNGLNGLLNSGRVKVEASNGTSENLIWPIVPFLILGVGVCLIIGIIVYVVWRAAKKGGAGLPSVQKPYRYWKWFGVTVLTTGAILAGIVVVGFIIPNFIQERKATLVQKQRAEANRKFGSVIPYQPPGNPEFGPVSEVTLPLHENGYCDTLQPDSGKIAATPEMNTPWEWRTTLLPDGIRVIPQTAAHPTILAGTSTLVCETPSGWEGPMALSDTINAGGMGVNLGETVMTSSAGSLPREFTFTTSSGRRGLLQVVSLTQNPPGVKVRYKLVQPATNAVPAANPVDEVTRLKVQIEDNELEIAKRKFQAEVLSRANDDLSIPAIVGLMKKAYATIWNYQDTGQTVFQYGTNDTWTDQFSEVLDRMNRYHIKVVTAQHPFSQTNQWWSDGETESSQQGGSIIFTNFHPAGAGGNISLVNNDTIVPAQFYHLNWGNIFDTMENSLTTKQLARHKDEFIDGVDCYVLEQAKMGLTVWVGKQDFLIRRYRNFISKERMEGMRQFLKNTNRPPMVAADIVNVETHENILVNGHLTTDVFQPLADDANTGSRKSNLEKPTEAGPTARLELIGGSPFNNVAIARTESIRGFPAHEIVAHYAGPALSEEALGAGWHTVSGPTLVPSPMEKMSGEWQPVPANSVSLSIPDNTNHSSSCWFSGPNECQLDFVLADPSEAAEASRQMNAALARPLDMTLNRRYPLFKVGEREAWLELRELKPVPGKLSCYTTFINGYEPMVAGHSPVASPTNNITYYPQFDCTLLAIPAGSKFNVQAFSNGTNAEKNLFSTTVTNDTAQAGLYWLTWRPGDSTNATAAGWDIYIHDAHTAKELSHFSSRQPMPHRWRLDWGFYPGLAAPNEALEKVIMINDGMAQPGNMGVPSAILGLRMTMTPLEGAGGYFQEK